jgi:hypothetical protein
MTKLVNTVRLRDHSRVGVRDAKSETNPKTTIKEGSAAVEIARVKGVNNEK